MEDIFSGKKDLIPKQSDLSYYNWTLQKVYSTDSTFFRVDAGPSERLSFRNNTNRKTINVDLEYLEKHSVPDVKRIPVDLSIGNKKKEKDTKNKKNQGENFKKDIIEEHDSKEKEDESGYRQIVIFDYETKGK